MPVSDECEPIQRREIGCLSALWWGLLTEIAFTLAGVACGTLGSLGGRMDGWFVWSMMACGTIAALIGLPFSILATVLVRRMG